LRILSSAFQSTELQLLLKPFCLAERIQGQEGLASLLQQMDHSRAEWIHNSWLSLAANSAIGPLDGFARGG
jgi:hypothetical protein